MSTRVNLLLADEIRPTTTVSRELMIRLGAAVAGMLVTVWIGWAVWTYMSVTRRHAEASRQWAAIEGDYEGVTALQNELNDFRAYLDELDGWRTSRVLWDESFSELREIVPENMQLTRLTVTGSIQAPPAEDGRKAVPYRRFVINLDGLAEGQLAHQDIIQFVDSLRVGHSFSPWLASVKLQGLQRQARNPQTAPEDAVDLRTFRVDATSKERAFQ